MTDVAEEPWEDILHLGKCLDFGLEGAHIFLYSNVGRRGEKNRKPQDVAKAICNGTETTEPCPIRERCLWEGNNRPGVWGGMIESERHDLYADERRKERDQTAGG